MKGTIKLNQVKTVETVEEGKLDEKKNVFQVRTSPISINLCMEHEILILYLKMTTYDVS